MCDASGQGPDSLHFLCLLELGFHIHMFSNITDHKAPFDCLSVPVHLSAQCQTSPDQGTVLPDHPHMFVPNRLTFGKPVTYCLEPCFAIVCGRKQVQYNLAD